MAKSLLHLLPGLSVHQPLHVPSRRGRDTQMPPWMTPSFPLKYCHQLFLEVFYADSCAGLFISTTLKATLFDGRPFNRSRPCDRRGDSCCLWIHVSFTFCWAPRTWDVVPAVTHPPEQLEEWGGRALANWLGHSRAPWREVLCAWGAVVLMGIWLGAITDTKKRINRFCLELLTFVGKRVEDLWLSCLDVSSCSAW